MVVPSASDGRFQRVVPNTARRTSEPFVRASSGSTVPSFSCESEVRAWTPATRRTGPLALSPRRHPPDDVRSLPSAGDGTDEPPHRHDGQVRPNEEVRHDECPTQGVRVGITERDVPVRDERLAELDANAVDDGDADDEQDKGPAVDRPVGRRGGECVSEDCVRDEVAPLVQRQRVGFPRVDDRLRRSGQDRDGEDERRESQDDEPPESAREQGHSESHNTPGGVAGPAVGRSVPGRDPGVETGGRSSQSPPNYRHRGQK